MKVVHIITSLNAGGAQAVLCNLIFSTDDVEHTVISLMGCGHYDKVLEARGVNVISMDVGRGRVSLPMLARIFTQCRKLSPDIIQTWLYHADLVGSLVCGLFTLTRMQRPRLVWGIHNSNLDPCRSRRLTIGVVKLLSWLSYIAPRRIVCCSRSSIKTHAEQGYCRSKMVLITNGHELDRFRPQALATRMRHDAIGKGKTERCFRIGCVARWDPQKDHANLLVACEKFRDTGEENFLCDLVGPGMEEGNVELLDLIAAHDLQSHVKLRGFQPDIPEFLNQWDCLVLPSAFGEAYPNVVAEAMACGVPAIVTDVGDSAQMVQGTGWVAPPQDGSKLAQCLVEVNREVGTQAWTERRTRCREKALQEFSVQKMSAQYLNLWRTLALKNGA